MANVWTNARADWLDAECVNIISSYLKFSESPETFELWTRDSRDEFGARRPQTQVTPADAPPHEQPTQRRVHREVVGRRATQGRAEICQVRPGNIIANILAFNYKISINFNFNLYLFNR